MQQRTFEQSLGRLEEIVRIMERGDAPLDAALALFEEGTALARGCAAQLDSAEQKVALVIKGANGEPVEKPFENANG
ncbi:MAG: exodeoxyribonuclease VII small subunit [Oscillospiraceae bacterium]|jgi:exodeoxyribonuclease VII small subunit|nr:exodeoxyribonuclease VII small subunit [Oscillospiraceae bacterium]